jgi:hypothetical protein
MRTRPSVIASIVPASYLRAPLAAAASDTSIQHDVATISRIDPSRNNKDGGDAKRATFDRRTERSPGDT